MKKFNSNEQVNNEDNNKIVTAFNTVASICAVYKGSLQDHQIIQTSLELIKTKLNLTNKEITDNIKAQIKEKETK